MKKILITCLALSFSIGAMACGGDKKEKDKPKSDKQTERNYSN